MTTRLYLDEDINPQLARLLRARGYDAISCHETGSRLLTDGEQLEQATTLGRSIVSTNYGDFLLLADESAASGKRHAGIIVSYKQCTNDRLDSFARALALIVDSFSAENLADTTISLGDFIERSGQT